MKRRLLRNLAGAAVLAALGVGVYGAALLLVALAEGGHGDAAAVFLVMLAILAVMDRAHTRQAAARRATFRALRDLDRRAYWRIWHQWQQLLHATTGLDQHAAQAVDVARPDDEPIRYEIPPNPYAPVFTTGGCPSEFGEVVRRAFPKETR